MSEHGCSFENIAASRFELEHQLVAANAAKTRAFDALEQIRECLRRGDTVSALRLTDWALCGVTHSKDCPFSAASTGAKAPNAG